MYGGTLVEHADLLVDVLTPFPDVRIALSTSWVRVYESIAPVAGKARRHVRPGAAVKAKAGPAGRA
jgi:hypothetical protein